MLWPAAKMGDMVIGLDFHSVSIPPVPVVPMVPHPYFGAIFLWMTPGFPKVNTLINGMPACTSGAMGYSVHIPMGLPIPPSMLNMAYWRRYLLTYLRRLCWLRSRCWRTSPFPAFQPCSCPRIRRPESSSRMLPVLTPLVGAAFGGRSKEVSLLTPVVHVDQTADAPVPYPGGQGSAAIGSPTSRSTVARWHSALP